MEIPVGAKWWLPEVFGKRARLVLTASSILLVWIASFFLARRGFEGVTNLKGIDLTTILLGAASIALFIFSILIAILAIFGWQAIEGKIREAVEAVTSRRLEAIESEVRGRAFAILGYVMGEASVSDDLQKPSNPERLREAIYLTQLGYDRLRKAGGPGEFMALNNLVTYSSILGDKSRRGFILESARRLRAAGEEHDVPNLQLTYCRAVLEFGLEPAEVEEACALVEAIRSHPRLQSKEKREAEYLASRCAGRPPGRSGQPTA